MTEATESNAEDPNLKGPELAFARAYVELGPVIGRGAHAAIKAGYSEKNSGPQASRLLRKANVAAYIRAREHEIADILEEKQLLNREMVIDMLFTAHDRAMQAEEVMEYDHTEGKMIGTGEYSFDGKTAVRCIELLGKSIGMFNGKDGEKDAPFNLTINLGDSPAPAPKKAAMVDVTPKAPEKEFTPFDLPTVNLD